MAYGSVNVPGHVPEAATTSKAGLMSAADKAKLDSLGKNLTFTGAVTGTYNGETDKTFLIPDRKGCRFIVGTSTNGWTEKDCDYLCDGTDDQVEINAAINALPSTGGEVVILTGTYNISAPLSFTNQKIIGEHRPSVILKRQNYSSSNFAFITLGSHSSIENLTIDGNLGQAPDLSRELITMKDFTGVKNCDIKNYNYVFLYTKGSNTLISNNYFCNGLNSCIDVRYNFSLVAGNTIDNFTYSGIRCSANCNKIINNPVTDCLTGIYCTNNSTTPGYNLIIGNYVNIGTAKYISGYTGAGNGIQLIFSGSFPDDRESGWIVDSNIIQDFTNNGISIRVNNVLVCNNLIYANQSTANQCGIFVSGDRNNVTDNYISAAVKSILASGDNNLIANNLIWGKNYTNSGTGNTFVNNKYN